MFNVKRFSENPVLLPHKASPWEAEAAFNPSVAEKQGVVHLLYRGMSSKTRKYDVELEISSIGHTASNDGVDFGGRSQFIRPEYDWERFGCEDPRVTEFEGQYFIFYTAISKYPFSADGIRVGLAITKDFKTIDEKHLVTPFNAKAMALFPERINGKIAALLTVHTDMPPALICLALFDRVEDIWSEVYWKKWYADLPHYAIEIEKNERDHIEMGAPPLKTKDGWLVFYSYIYNYFSPPPTFGIQAALLDVANPKKVVGEVKRPFFIPEEEYEVYGRVPNVVFPTGALVRKQYIYLYYGAADTSSCLAIFKLSDLIEQLVSVAKRQLKRYEGNPIIAPMVEHKWEAKATFNPGVLYEDGRVHLLYRAMSEDNTSVLGYASFVDGIDMTERHAEPVYTPREDFERKLVVGANSGCEDPRLTRIGDTIYMCYTAFDGKHPPRVAFTSIALEDFLHHRWNWARPVLISPPGSDDKDAALFPKTINGRYAFLHRLGVDVWIDFVDDLRFTSGKFLEGQVLLKPRESAWDSKRIGIAGPPIETKYGWLLLYHGISRRTSHYSVRAALLDLKDPTKVIHRNHDSILDPKMPYEKEGIVPNVVFPCGTAVIRNQLFVYYGGADKVVGVAMVDLDVFLASLLHEAQSSHKKK